MFLAVWISALSVYGISSVKLRSCLLTLNPNPDRNPNRNPTGDAKHYSHTALSILVNIIWLGLSELSLNNIILVQNNIILVQHYTCWKIHYTCWTKFEQHYTFKEFIGQHCLRFLLNFKKIWWTVFKSLLSPFSTHMDISRSLAKNFATENFY